MEYPTASEVVTAQSEGLRFRIDDYREYIQRNIYFMGYHEYRETRLLRKLLRPGDTFVDVGANIGWFTILAARLVGEKGKVVAFEPSSAIYDHLTANVSLNGLSNVQAERTALSDTNGTAVLTGIGVENAGTGTILATGGSLGEEVPTMRFDDYCSSAGLEYVALMKIDVEGAEMMVLEGATESLHAGSIGAIVIEVSDERLRSTGSSSTELIELLRGAGYTISRANTTGLQPLEPGEHVEFSNLVAQRS
jgi:FkbM family methyltransferase